jgi:hypothetical protein
MDAMTRVTGQQISSFDFGIILYSGGAARMRSTRTTSDGAGQPQRGLYVSTDVTMVAPRTCMRR